MPTLLVLLASAHIAPYGLGNIGLQLLLLQDSDSANGDASLEAECTEDMFWHGGICNTLFICHFHIG